MRKWIGMVFWKLFYWLEQMKNLEKTQELAKRVNFYWVKQKNWTQHNVMPKRTKNHIFGIWIFDWANINAKNELNLAKKFIHHNLNAPVMVSNKCQFVLELLNSEYQHAKHMVDLSLIIDDKWFWCSRIVNFLSINSRAIVAVLEFPEVHSIASIMQRNWNKKVAYRSFRGLDKYTYLVI